MTSGSFCNYYKGEIGSAGINASDSKSFAHKTKIVRRRTEILHGLVIQEMHTNQDNRQYQS